MIKKYFSTLKVIIFILFFLTRFNLYSQNEKRAVKGELNLTEWKTESQEAGSLDGEWEFYWNQLLSPENFSIKADTSKRIFVKVPGYWNNYSIDNKKLSDIGYGTYRLIVKLKKSNNLFLRIGTILSSYKVWVDNKLIGEVGKVGTSKQNYQPSLKVSNYLLDLSQNQSNDSIISLQILIQVANFYNKNAGIVYTIELETFKKTAQSTRKRIFFDSLMIGILLIISIYYIILFFLNRRDLSALYFSIFAFLMVIRSGLTNTRILPEMVPYLDNYFLLMRLEYLSAYLNIAFVALFFSQLFKNAHNKIVIQIIVGLSILFSIIIIFTPIHFFTSLRDVYNLYGVISAAYIAYYALFKAVLNKEQGAIPAYIGMFVLFGTAILDVISIIFILPIPQIAPLGLVFYVIMQAFVLAHRFSHSFKENLALSAQLNIQNENLEKIVDERTFELKERNEELLSAEEELRQNNEELLVLNENIENQKQGLERANSKLLGQAAMANILKKVTDSSLDTNEFLQYVLDTLLELPWLQVIEKGSIFVTNTQGNLEMVAQKDLGILTKMCAIIKPGQCLCGKALKDKELIFRNHINHEHEITPDGMQPHGHYNVPLIFNDRVVGVLNLYVQHNHKKTKQEEEFLLLLSDVLAAVIQRKQLQNAIEQQSNELFQQNEKLNSLKDSLEQKEKRLETIIENQGEGFALVDINGNFSYTNSAAEEIFKVSKSKLVSKNLGSFFNIEELNDLNSKVEKLKAKEKFVFELLAQTAKNELRFIHATITPDFSENENKQGYIINFRDITEIKKAEEKIREANIALKKYFVAIEQSPLTIVITDTNAQIEYVNPAFTKISGYSLGDMKITPRLLKSGKTSKETYKSMWTTITKGEIWEGEFINRKKDKTEFIERAIIAPIKSEKNEIINYVAIKEDITERKLSETKIKEQHKQLEKAFKNIKGSINYAQSLQKAILTLDSKSKIFLGNHFLLFIPRDQVSGDFYYVNKIKDTIIFAVGDCTGHGVPGAFLSILSYTFLHEIVRNQDVNHPAQALEKLRNIIKDTFKNSSNKNGLDIALCAINSKNNTIEFSGAHNPLVILRNHKLIEYKGTFNPIGNYPNEIPFTNHSIKLQNKDRLYLFSDGFIDQFGGEKNRKFMRAHFYQVIEKLEAIPMNQQSEVLSEIFTKWKANNNQVDDVTILGLEWEI